MLSLEVLELHRKSRTYVGDICCFCPAPILPSANRGRLFLWGASPPQLCITSVELSTPDSDEEVTQAARVTHSSEDKWLS